MAKPRIIRIGDSLPIVQDPTVPREVRTFTDRVRDVLTATGDGAIVRNEDLKKMGLVDNNMRPVAPPQEDDYLPPPAVVTGFAAAGAFQNVILTWDQPDYNGHAYTEVWGSPIFDTSIPPDSPGYVNPATLNNLELAGPIGITTGAVFTDDIGGSKGRYYWARNVNRLDDQGPFNAVSGTLAETAVDVEFLLTTLTDAITSSQLAVELATPISTIPAITTTANDALAQVQAAQADVDSALAGVATNANGITTLTATTDTLTANLSALSTTVDSNSSSIVSLQTTTADQATALTNLTTRVDTAESGITSLETTTADQATALTNLTTRVTTAEGDIATAESNISNLLTTTANQATTLTNLTTRVDTAESGITTLETTTANQATALTSLTTRVTDAEGDIATAESNISNLQTTTANQATAITQLSSSVAGNTAAIQTEATTRASQTGELYAQYTVKIDINGYVSGFGLASTPVDGGGVESEFAVLANRFYVAAPGLSFEQTPFIIQTTSTTINGVAVPAGVYMADAFIRNGSIVNAKIANAAIDNAKIASLDAGKITTGYLNADRIQVGSLDGKIATFSGALSAATGTFAGLVSGGSITIGGPNDDNFIVDYEGNITQAGGYYRTAPDTSPQPRVFIDGRTWAGGGTTVGRYALWIGTGTTTAGTPLFYIDKAGNGFIKGEFFQGQIIETRYGTASGSFPITATISSSHNSVGNPVELTGTISQNLVMSGDTSGQASIIQLTFKRGGTTVSTVQFQAIGFYNSGVNQTRYVISTSFTAIDSGNSSGALTYSVQATSVSGPTGTVVSQSNSCSIKTFENKFG